MYSSRSNDEFLGQNPIANAVETSTVPENNNTLVAKIVDGVVYLNEAPSIQSLGNNTPAISASDIKQAFPEYKNIKYLEVSLIKDSDFDKNSQINTIQSQALCIYDFNNNGVCDSSRNIMAYTTATTEVGDIVWTERHSCPRNAVSCNESTTVTKTGTVSVSVNGKYSIPALAEISGGVQGSYTWTNTGISSIVMKPGACNEAFVKTISTRKEGYYTAEFYEGVTVIGRKPTGDYWSGKKPYMEGKGWKTCS